MRRRLARPSTGMVRFCTQLSDPAVFLLALVVCSAVAQFPIHPLPGQEAASSEHASHQHMLDHVKGQHDQLLEKAKLASHQGLPEDQRLQRGQMLEALKQTQQQHPGHEAALGQDPSQQELLKHMKNEHDKLLETAKVARHQGLPEDQRLQRGQMLEALKQQQQPQRRRRGVGLSTQEHAQHHRVNHATSSASSLLRAQALKWPDGYMAICAVVKDQSQDLRYWLQYHLWMGVSKFYIFDHNSSSPVMPSIIDHVRSGSVEYQYFVGRPRSKPSFKDTNQYLAYQRCLVQHYRRHRWMAFIDVDEFLVLQPSTVAQGTTQMGTFLDQYEKEGLGGIGANWVLFGSSGVLKRPAKGPLASFTSCIPQDHTESHHVKVIVNTKYILNMGGTPHEVELRKGANMVDENKHPYQGPKTPKANWDKLAVYHYVLKSKEEFAGKMARGSGAGNIKTWAYWDYVEELATATCEWGLNVSERFLATEPNLELKAEAPSEALT